ncbi:MAG: hypothetical protein ACFB15_04630 [Cyclobacteriaceae bacterium]
MTTSYAKSTFDLASIPPTLLLYVKANEAITTRLPQHTEFSPAKYTHATHKITRSTKKINTTLVRKEAMLLMHLTSDSNQIVVRVTDTQGRIINATQYTEMEAGFYEVPVLPETTHPQLYFVSLIINHQAYSFQISPN